MDELCERAKGYIQMEEMSRFKNEVRKAKQKRDKREGSTKADSHKSDKLQLLLKGPKYECYSPLTVNRTTIQHSPLSVLRCHEACKV